MPISRLPNEVLDCILCYLSLSDISSASRVSHAWQACVFPRLYSTVYLSHMAHLKSFAKRVKLDDDRGPLSITANTRGLVLTNEFGDGFIGHLKTIIPRLYDLRRLCWDLPCQPGDTEIFHLFQTCCPKLDSVDLSIHHWSSLFPEAYSDLMEFTNLSHFSLTVICPTFLHRTYLNPVVSLIVSSPNLTSLSVNLHCQDDDILFYSPSTLVKALGNVTLPRLHTFHARGSADTDRRHRFSHYRRPGGTPEQEPADLQALRAFFLRHPGIKDLALGWATPIEHPVEIDPEYLAQLFPSLKHFEGPSCLCHAIVASSLSSQLESLIIIDHTVDEEIDDPSLEDFIGEETNLPRLRRLAVWAPYEDGMEVWPLVRLTRAATAFEGLELRSDVANYEDFLDLLGQLPHLRCLTLDYSILCSADNYYAQDEEGPYTRRWDWEWLLLKLKRVCPRVLVREYLTSEVPGLEPYTRNW